MKRGALALIDALGFRGIWRRHEPATVLGALSGLKEKVEADLAHIATQPHMQFDVAFLSDTIALALSLPPEAAPDPAALSLLYVTDIVSRILYYSAHSPVPLAYRGSVTFGEYEVGPNFLIGEAVDEVASAYESSQGAIVWLMPRAREPVANWLRSQPRNTHLVRMDVPLKGGDSFNTYSASPLVQAFHPQDALDVVQSILATFSLPTVDVAVKRDNTVKHLRACWEWRRDLGDTHGELAPT